MDLSDLLVIDAVLPRLKSANKKQALQEMAAKAAALTSRDERDIFETLMQREKLGSTGVGHGVAIPHGKLAGLDRLVGVFALLDRPIDFDSLDGEPVDVMFLLLAPESAGADHLKALARIARVLRDDETAAKLRAADDAAAMYTLLTENVRSDAA
ncbi:PTS IIA-like nitrogen-regulatory protein PtsN [Pleomorphomonas diazotrophica]|uniref:PTS IIA-like nitrogen-regulatory protein PtsN n=1 Tax=Pleomorphomonas diazotrophica TaxID=1166257 RepID=A0A1I4SQG1_9HYPH|nr:PTS IIA-like nitrogen regulatory protein PtsN [Pleomorphomonas diazotrophica]PKR88459.1 PTS IIA-like nitrogen-regulatory protein PtsN [Pleomorphomonas diazotrophica]SFM66639.1 PTS IIA-like nitrogen-regulatory protein PtsN [Pleomorphomonas diazotrophica]